ncbi:MAG: hypothetical protein HYV01_20040 [Deltaproteobacteria bacterium]|nr:hypothetical protein [Deltaproteobacteria bacterium]MBI2367269.1 hypothetical protein [Deltaproteobacteria bacterium]
MFWRETYPKLKQQLQRNYPKHDWREQALIHTQNTKRRMSPFRLPIKSINSSLTPFLQSIK